MHVFFLPVPFRCSPIHSCFSVIVLPSILLWWKPVKEFRTDYYLNQKYAILSFLFYYSVKFQPFFCSLLPCVPNGERIDRASTHSMLQMQTKYYAIAPWCNGCLRRSIFFHSNQNACLLLISLSPSHNANSLQNSLPLLLLLLSFFCFSFSHICSFSLNFTDHHFIILVSSDKIERNVAKQYIIAMEKLFTVSNVSSDQCSKTKVSSP